MESNRPRLTWREAVGLSPPRPAVYPCGNAGDSTASENDEADCRPRCSGGSTHSSPSSGEERGRHSMSSELGWVPVSPMKMTGAVKAPEARPETTSTETTASPKKMPKKRGRKPTRKAEYLRNPRLEITDLRKEVAMLAQHLHELQARRNGKRQRFSKWQTLAHQQAVNKQVAVMENKKLRAAHAELEQVRQNLMKVLHQPCPLASALLSTEDNEWRLNVLSRHPERKRLNAARILDAFRSTIISRAVSCGLLDSQPTAFARTVDFANEKKRKQRIEVNQCLEVSGNFVVVADRIWKRLMVPEVRSSAGASVTVQRDEQLDRDVHLVSSSLHVSKGLSYAKVNEQLICRFSEANRVLILTKSIFSNIDQATARRAVENSDGWIMLEKAPRKTITGGEVTILRSSYSVDILSLDSMVSAFVQSILEATKFNTPQGDSPSGYTQKDIQYLYGEFLKSFLVSYSKKIKQAALLCD